ncbi:hypothetical protein RHGRI_033913 [Rhododendron griersonianum]|uniref:Glycolipid transfer protein domain-containing protein n=1 Tax=Rhododendron griersonianum TaxID=479676 RepID=A0AAV6HZ11_9ERIC|nr:hypothetical protein RHGRI_033913 [Rhododendron griersonianum]
MAFRFLFSRTDRDQGMEEEDGGGAFEDANGETTMTTPLSAIAEAFEELSRTVGKFNVRDLVEASKIYGTLNNILDIDVKNDTVKTHGSLSRNLRRVRQGLDLIRALFKNFLSSELLDVLCAFRYCTLKEAASTAYAEVCAPYHTWAVRTAVSTGMYALPTREQLLLKLNETGEYAIAFIARII